jgi:ABC-type polar amino acid transport system ATPase subunit
MGASGGGKSTLLRCIAGLEQPDEGTIELGTKDLGMVFQAAHLFGHMTAIDNVALAPTLRKRHPRAEALLRAQALLDAQGVGHRAHALPKELSGGEAQRVSIARALAMEPKVWLLDEPTSALDEERSHEVAKMLTDQARAGATVLLVSHDTQFVEAVASRTVWLELGRLAAEPAKNAG